MGRAKIQDQYRQPDQKQVGWFKGYIRIYNPELAKERTITVYQKMKSIQDLIKRIF
jgi:ABC-type Fe3+ transport system substrate-binding protein